MKNTVILLVSLAVLCACQRTEEPRTYELAFAKYDFQLPEGTRGMISVAAGNGRYEVSVDDPEVLDARAQRQYRGFGEIVVTANKSGRTRVRVRDLKTDREAELNITVFHPHMELTLGQCVTAISGIEDETVRHELEQKMSSYQSFLSGYKYVLVKDENRTLYLFGPSEGYDNLLYTGTYRLYGKEEGVYCVSLEWDGAEKEFLMANSYTASVFNYMFSPDWTSTRAELIVNRLELAENLTGLFAADYPGLGSAHIAYGLDFRFSTAGPLLPTGMVTD